MDELVYDWYMGLRSSHAIGGTVHEALWVYLRSTDFDHHEAVEEVADAKVKSGIEFTGIDVELSKCDQMSIVENANKTTEKWLPLCMKHVPTADAKGKRIIQVEDSKNEDNCGVSSIKLQSSHHVTLFYYGAHDPRKQLEDRRIKDAYNEMDDQDLDTEALKKSLTPYEFAVALLYRQFYKIKFPFESYPSDTDPTVDLPTRSEVNVTLKHLIFVPGVVICATALLGGPLVALPAPDGILGPYTSYERGAQRSMQTFVEQCQEHGGIMLEEYHCTHVTLGVAKEYKPVVSNNICTGIKDYLQYLKESATSCKKEKPYFLKKVTTDRKSDDMEVEELLECLKVYGSDFSELKHAKANFVELSTAVANGADDIELMEAAKDSVFESAIRNTKTGAKHCYEKTMCFVSEDRKWVYIRYLPVDNNITTTDEKAEDRWIVDVYISALDKEVTGRIRFY